MQGMKTLLFTARLVVMLLLAFYMSDMALQRAMAAARASIDDSPSRTPPEGTYDVQTLLTTWIDASREREVPVKIYWPQKVRQTETAEGGSGDVEGNMGATEALKQPLPLLLFSHGLGGSREMYVYLGQYWASHGFIVVHVQHIGSDEALWRDNKRPMLAMKAATLDPRTAANRPKDISFAIDQMLALNADKDSPFYQKVDGQRIGAAGHSFGSYTVLALAGQGSEHQSRVAQKVMGELRDERVRAIIPMSAPVSDRAVGNADFRRQLYDPINLPVFHMTGTRDTSPISSATAASRRIPFDAIEKNDGYLLTFTDGDHMVFSGRRRNTRLSPQEYPEAIVPTGDPGSARSILERDAAEHAVIEQATLAFWRTYLLNDAVAKAWLQGEGFRKTLGNEGVFEMKLHAK